MRKSPWLAHRFDRVDEPDGWAFRIPHPAFPVHQLCSGSVCHSLKWNGALACLFCFLGCGATAPEAPAAHAAQPPPAPPGGVVVLSHSPEPATAGGWAVSGTITGGQVPDGSPLQVLWVVSAGSPDYAMVFGEGETRGSTFRVQLPGPPPIDALNAGQFGVGVVMLVSERLPQGRLSDSSALDRHVRGLADRFGIIFVRQHHPRVPWLQHFENGYGCGHGVPAAEGQTFDTFAPVDCGSLLLRLGTMDALDPVNWT